MKHAPSNVHIDRDLFGVLLIPSGLSGIITVCFSMLFCGSVIFLTRFQASGLRLDFLHYQASQISGTYQRVSDTLSSNNFISNLPLLIFWSLVGLVVYLFAANIFAAIRSTAELKNELDYVNADRHELLSTSLEHLLIRLIVLVAWAAYILFFFHHVLPYCMALSIASSAQISSFVNVGYALLAVFIMSVAIHLHVVLLRLLLLRPRLFTHALFVD